MNDDILDRLLVEVVDDILARRQRGELPYLDDYADRPPAVVAELRDLAPAIDLELEKPTVMPPVGTLPTIEGFDVEVEIGRGAMGVVYKTHELDIDRPVALKVLYPRADRTTHPRLRDRFANEARAAGRLGGDNIPAYRKGRVANDPTYGELHFYVMPLVHDGKTLLKEIETDGRLDARRVAEVGRTVARSLHTSHVAGVVHRDVKPANIVMDQNGEPHLGDYGVAHVVGPVAGDLSGTPAYMPPEQHRGQSSAASDQYALVVTMVHALTGCVPFVGDDLAGQK